jgi:hypothetical protein
MRAEMLMIIGDEELSDQYARMHEGGTWVRTEKVFVDVSHKYALAREGGKC